MPRASFFLRISTDKGDMVEGEADEHDFEGAIEAKSWDWGVSDKASKDAAAKDAAKDGGKQDPAKGHGDTGGQSYEPKPLRFTKETDRSTTRLLMAMLNGEMFPSAMFTLRQQWKAGIGGGREIDEEFLLHLILSDVRVTSYSFNASSEQDLDEDWVFSYRTMQFDYKSAPGRYKKGPGLGEEFVLPPGSKTTALKKPERTTADRDKDLAGVKAENERLKADIERLRRSKS
jgi:type VI protein secretion system component Hcp